MTTSTAMKRILVWTAALAVLGAPLVADATFQDKEKKKERKKNKASIEATSGQARLPKEVKQARVHLDAFETEAARQALAPLAGSDDLVVLTTHGRIEMQAKNYEGAVAALTQAAGRDAASPEASLYLGDALAYSTEKAAAKDAWREAEKRAMAMTAANPDSVEGLYLLGAAQQRQKRFAEAATTLEQARSLAPKDLQINFEVGVTYFYLEKWQQAFDALSAVLDKRPNFAYAYYYRGIAAGKLDRKDLLFNDLDRFVKMAPEAPEAASAKQILAAFG